MNGLARPRSKSLTLAVIVVVSLVGAAAPVTLAVDDGAPTPSASPEQVRHWPGTTASPGGLYSYRVGSDGARFMHKVPDDWSAEAPNGVELVFLSGSAVEEPERWIDPVWHALRWQHEYFGFPFADHPAANPNVVIQAWFLDVGDTPVAIRLTSYSDTDAALVAEAMAVVDSIAVRSEDENTDVLVFRLQDGWDSG